MTIQLYLKVENMERTTIVAQDEAACKLFEFLVAYHKMVGKVELTKDMESDNDVVIGVLSTPESLPVKVTVPDIL